MTDSYENIPNALAAGRPVREHGPYELLVGDESLNFRPLRLEDPVPTARQVLVAAGAQPVVAYSTFQWFVDGSLKELSLDDTVDLRTAGVERFLIFHSDRSFRFLLDDRPFEWGTMFISGLTLKILAKVDPTTYGVWLEVRGGEDRKIADQERVDLSKAGVERFFTGIVATTEG